MIECKAQPCRTVEAGAPIFASGDLTALIFCLETGAAKDGNGQTYGNGDLIRLCEALAFDNYSTPPALVDWSASGANNPLISAACINRHLLCPSYAPSEVPRWQP